MKTKLVIHFLAIWALLGVFKKGYSQFRGTNLAEFQLGNIPDLEPKDQSSLYDQLNLYYRYKQLSLSTMIENYSSFERDNNYIRLSQYTLNYKTKHVIINIGHMYNSFGRGLLMPNYEIPSSIYEDAAYRVRYDFYKDLHGISFRYRSKKFNLKLIRGRVLIVDLPPTINDNEQDRRSDLIEGGEVSYNIQNHTIGAIFMRHILADNIDPYASFYYESTMGNFTIYGELSHRIDSIQSVASFGNDDSFGAYFSISYTANQLGVSLETKKYNNYLIGNGVNDPPTLIKEHSSRLLNRSTHVPLIVNESGYQAEVFYQLPNASILIFNHALARNVIATNTFTFREYYLEYKFDLTQKISTRVFADYSINPLINEKNRYTGGFDLDINHTKLSSAFSAELQHVEREILAKESIYNLYLSYTLSRSGKFSINILTEVTTGPNLLPEDKSSYYYPSGSITYDIDRKNKVTVFYGRRRGGPACTSGVCYDVLDLKDLKFV